VGRPERVIPEDNTPLAEFARGLRALRRAAGQPSYRRLSVATHYSSATLARAAGGQVLPSLEVTLAFAAACGGDAAEWRAAWSAAASRSRPEDGRARTGAPPAGRPVPAPPVGEAGGLGGPSGAEGPGDQAGPAPRPVPAQLPADTADFTGRQEQADLLCALLAAQPPPSQPGAVAIAAVAGMGGIGKTTLAVHVAHRLRGRFPGGQLYASLQGANSPLRPDEVLARFLRDLGVPDAAVPAGEDERAAAYRTALADRRILIVLDDAADPTQVRPLLPGTAGCAVIVTSRTTLAALPGARLLDLGVLSQDEARALLAKVTGPARAAAEPEATASVLASCAGLPLAIRIAASRLAARPGWTVSHLAARLAGEQSRLAELTTGDLAVRASLAVSYNALVTGRTDATDPARVFRLLGLAGMAALALPAITALVGQPAAQVTIALDILTDSHLLQSPAPDHYRLHDLLRAYATELATSTDSEDDRNQVVSRMLRWYGEQAVLADRVLEPERRFPDNPLFRVPTPAHPWPTLAHPAQALRWYETELANLVTAAQRAASLGLHDVASQIAFAMRTFFIRTPHREDWLAVSEIGVASARHLGDDGTLAGLLDYLAQAYAHLGRFAESRRCLDEELSIHRRTGNRISEATALNSLAVNLCYQDLYAEALEYLHLALDISTAVGHKHSAAISLANIGHALVRLKHPGKALDYLTRALALHQETGHRYMAAVARSTLAEACLDLGRFQDAAEHYQRARDAMQGSAREHRAYADILYGLGRALAALGRYAEAREAWEAASPVLNRIGDPRAAELRIRLVGQRLPSGGTQATSQAPLGGAPRGSHAERAVASRDRLVRLRCQPDASGSGRVAIRASTSEAPGSFSWRRVLALSSQASCAPAGFPSS
jgi:tetratricopeptide (TPR) repeat protein